MQTRFIPKVQMMAVDQLRPAGFNPERRTDRSQIRLLMETIREVGGIIQPIIVSADMLIIDGHRRHAAAKALGMAEVPIIISPLSITVGWRVLNISSMHVTSRDWIQAHHKGMPLENLPRKARRDIERIIELAGPDTIDMLADRGFSTSVLEWSTKLAKYIENKTGRQRPDDKLLSDILLWMIRNNQQYAARKALEAEMSRRLLRFAIENDEKLSSGT